MRLLPAPFPSGGELGDANEEDISLTLPLGIEEE